ncbi:MAG TPA: PQQ-binding-like beta-propeller repeat protein [Pirellulales bacterium]|nr:PQQ-binding-like beta-propeller repeat protein [Pirellulales bacterium]
MPNTEKIIAVIEQSDLVTADVVDQLRSKLDRAPAMSLRAAVKWLVEKRHISTAQGGRLLAKVEEADDKEDDLDLMPKGEADDIRHTRGAIAATSGWQPSDLDEGDDIRQTRGAPAAAEDDDLEMLPLDGTGAPSDPGKQVPARSPSAGSGGTARWAGTPPSTAPRAKAPAKTSPAQSSPPKSVPSAPRSPAARPPSARPPAAGGAPRGRESKAAPPAAPKGGLDDRGDPNGADGADDLFETGGMEHSPSAASQDALAPTGRKSPKPSRKQEDYGSPLLMILGASVLLVTLAVIGLYWVLGRGSADKAFTAAEELYNSGSYPAAVKKFDDYLKAYPNDSHASQAKVHQAMANMRMAVEGGGRDATKPLAEAKEILASIAEEEEFADARKELAALLPSIAERLAGQAAEKLDRTLVEQSREATKLVEKYVPKDIRPHQKMSDIAASLANTEMRMGRDAALAQAVADIDKAIDDGTPHDAYQIRKQLLKNYQDLIQDEALQAAVLKVSQAERAGVKFVAEERAAESADPKSPVEAEMATFDTQGGPASGVTGEVLFVLAGGAVYGIDAESGKALWRRFVGFDTDFVPQGVSVEPASDAILVDSARQEVLRVAATNGELRWRHVVGEPFDAHPVITGNRLSLATRSGRLIRIDLAGGKSPGYVQLPQGLRVGPAFDARDLFCYQIGETANLFVLTAAGDQCKEVFYLGHEPDAIRVPPVVVGPYVFVVENRGVTDAVLRVLLTDEAGISLRQVQHVVLAGHVFAPLLVSDRRLVATTDRGAIYSFEIATPDPGPPLSEVASKPAENGDTFIRYPLLKDARLFVAGQAFTRYDIQAAQGKLEARWHWDETDTFLGPPRIIGEVAYHVRRKGQAPNVLVAAVKAGDGARIWETSLAAPMAGATLPDAAGHFTLLNAAGSLFDVASEGLSGRGGLKAVDSSGDLSGSFSAGARAVTLEEDALLLVGGTGEARARIAEKSSAGRLRWLALPDPLGSTPIAFAGGLLVPGRLGQVFVIDPQDGHHLIGPFQPRLPAGVEYVWSDPVKLSEKEVLLADGRGKLYRVGIAQQATPHLVKLAEADLAGPVTSPIVVLGETALAVDGTGELRSFAVSDLASGPSWPLEGGAAWGPFVVAGRVLVATQGGELLCIDDARKEVWRVPLPYGALVGTPLSDDGGYLLAAMGGVVYRIGAENGAELAQVDIGEPLAAGPVALGRRLLLSGHDGTLLVVAGPPPSQAESQ